MGVKIENEIQAKIIQIIASYTQKTLGKDDIDKDFASFGLDSLKVLQVIPAIEKEFAIQFSEIELFDLTTLRKITDCVQTKLTTNNR